MPPIFYEIIFIYFIFVSLVSVALTVYDKYASRARPESRVRERTLMAWGALGGAACMYVTMQFIRHKTKHVSFMVGLPAMIILHALVCYAVYYFDIASKL